VRIHQFKTTSLCNHSPEWSRTVRRHRCYKQLHCRRAFQGTTASVLTANYFSGERCGRGTERTRLIDGTLRFDTPRFGPGRPGRGVVEWRSAETIWGKPLAQQKPTENSRRSLQSQNIPGIKLQQTGKDR